MQMVTKFEMSEEAKKIVDFVQTTFPGSRFTYDFLRNLTGVNDMSRLRGYINTAFKHAFSKHGMRFQAERGIGYVRLDESGKNAEVTTRIVGVARRVKRTEKIHRSVDFRALDPVGKLEHVVNGMQMVDLKKASSRATRDRMAETADSTGAVQAAISSTLEMFKRKNR
jgi:hypothetical protein